ncbi:MAG: NifB/NifX family molybdenum-iron cluster-binding protein [Candidatus Cloacimonetes bacterium]|nr:NifB/NifX family molybdenum-iron cluster-binding protein [Candidatus Cloacimonadota bacterium]
MKIAVPVNENHIESGICPSFGRSPYYLIYTTDTKDEQYLTNPAANSQGGAGIKAAQFLVDQKVNVVLVPRCGDNAAEVLHAAGINIFKSQGESVQENIDAFEHNKLAVLDQFHGGFHGHHG